MKHCEKKSGFTLIELLVVVLIIGILSAVALPRYEKAVAKSRFVSAMIAGEALYKATEVYELANGKFPSKLSELDISMPGTVTDEDKVITDQYRCNLFGGQENAADSVMCTVRAGSDAWGFRRYSQKSEHKKRYCFAVKDEEKENNWCKMLGNKFLHTAGSYNYYELD